MDLQTASTSARLDWRVVGLALGTFLAVSFAVCVGFDLLFPRYAMYPVWAKLLPGFTWLTWSSFLLGFIESFGWGIYIGVIFCLLYNFFARRFANGRERVRR